MRVNHAALASVALRSGVVCLREGGSRSPHSSPVSGGFLASALSLDHSAAFTAAGLETRGLEADLSLGDGGGGLSHCVPAPPQGAAP